MNDRIDGSGGTYGLEVTTAHTGLSLSQIVANTAATFTTLTITDTDGNTYNALSNKATVPGYGQNMASFALAAGGMIAAPRGSWYSAVTMSAGTAIGVITRNK